MKLLKHIEHLIKASAGRYCSIHGSKITTGGAARKLEVQLGVPTVKKTQSSSYRDIFLLLLGPSQCAHM